MKTSAEALQQAIDDNFWQAEYRDYRRPLSKPAPGSEGYRAISLSLFQISSILGSGE
ncbi:hypothetical protein ACNKHK_11100 [Shigella flexneri]